MSPIPGTAQASGTSDRLTDAQGDQAILVRSITVGGQPLANVLALPAGFGISQVGPFLTWVNVEAGQATGTSIVYGDNNAFAAGDFLSVFGPASVSFVMVAPAVVDYMQTEDGGLQNTIGYSQRFTGAGSGQNVDIEQWLDQSGNYMSGVDCNANVYATLYDVNQDVFPSAGSACTPREGMLGWNYTAHTLMAYGADNAWHVVGGPYG